MNDLLQAVAAGEKKSVAGLFNLLEDRREGPAREAARLLDRLYARSLARGHAIGITGPPGVGKSCLVSRLIGSLRAAGRTVGVIAVDPSSRVSGGALLGDRIRFDYDVSDPGVFVRSMANRGALGGVADRTFAGSIVLRAAFDVALIETVGVGQAETDVAALVDTTALVIQPASGDVLQFLKAGIMEEPHLLLVNKADLGAPAKRALGDVRAALGRGSAEGEGWTPKPLLVSAEKGTGIEEFAAETERHFEHLKNCGKLEARRRRQAAQWVWRELLAEFGARGSESLGGPEAIEGRLEREETRGPFGLFASLAASLEGKNS